MIHLSRSTAVFAVRLLLSVAVVYRFFHAENKSIFAQRYCPCTPPDGTKHTNVRRTGTKYKTNVKDMHYPLIPCGFLPLAPLAEMRYTGNTETNVKENSFGQNLTVLPAPSGREALAQPETLPLCQRPHPRGRLPPLRGKMSPQVTKRGICHGAAVTGGVCAGTPSVLPLRVKPPSPRGRL